MLPMTQTQSKLIEKLDADCKTVETEFNSVRGYDLVVSVLEGLKTLVTDFGQVYNEAADMSLEDLQEWYQVLFMEYVHYVDYHRKQLMTELRERARN